MKSPLKILSLIFFCFSIFDCLASSEGLRTNSEIEPFLDLENLSYKKKGITQSNQANFSDVSLVSAHVSGVDRTEELKKCRYLTGEELKADWNRFRSGNRNWLNEARYLVFDTEVNNPKLEGEIIEISLLEYINGKPTGLEFSTFIRPHSKEFSPYSQKVHGITYSELLDKPYFSEIAEQLEAFIGGSLVLAHNAPFDTRMLSQEYEKLPGNQIYKFHYKCTYGMHRRGEWRRDNPGKIKSSPIKVKTVQTLSKEEINARNSAKRKLALEKKIKAENSRKKKRALESSGSNSHSHKSKRRKTVKKKPSTGSLGYFKDSLGLNAENIPPILGVEKELTGQHHNASYDTYLLAVKIEQFKNELILKQIKSSQSSSDENNPNALNIHPISQSHLTQPNGPSGKILAPLDLNGVIMVWTSFKKAS